MLRTQDRPFVRPRRLVAFALGIVMLFVVLSVRLWDLQITNGAYYRELAEQNRVVRVPVPADRGIVVDRNGVVLARNLPGFAVTLIPYELPRSRENEIASRLAVRLDRSTEEIVDAIAAQRRRNPYEPVKLTTRPVQREVALLLVERAEIYPGVPMLPTMSTGAT
ncbi:MAG: hypothetical protein AABZ26_03845, partial [Chloroflexota bacterium]